ncbi:hypothetical protein LY13_003370 [Prauserella aidingensis]|nr:hypothetical protein [Prauserella aidingensis]
MIRPARPVAGPYRPRAGQKRGAVRVARDAPSNRGNSSARHAELRTILSSEHHEVRIPLSSERH